MATDFTNNNTTINSSGAFQPTTRNTPLDVRTRVNLKADIDSIPNPFIGMKILVLQDETNNNEMTEYIVVSLKANSLGIADSKVNEVVLAKDFIGVPTKTSQLTNDSSFATETYVNNKIAEASLSGGNVDLSGYVTKETGNANQITFSDGETLQTKLNSGTLKGDKGDKGDAGATEARGVSIEDTGNNFVATNVENALAELFQITSELANKISQILGSTIKINSLNKLSNCKFKLINSTSDTNYNSIEEANKSFNDDSWNTVSIPHDWSIYNDFNQNSPASYDAGYLDGGDAWYRFKLKTAKLRGQKIYIYFDGVYMESDVYINGTKVKANKWYNPFYVDVTDYLGYNNNDVLAVFVRNQQPSSRWYSGSGIIRNVYLISANEIEVGLHDIKITSPDLSTQYNSNVTTNIGLTIKNETLSTSTYKIRNTIYYNNTEKATNTVNLTLDGNLSQYFATTLVVNNPTLWDEYAGNLYVLRTELLDDWNNIIHSVDTYFGYRYFSFDKDTGFWLNGKNIKIRGVCLHHDLGCIGAEINKSAVERQIRLLKEMGCNAIRLTHNPASQEILDVCAKEGMLAVEEFFDCWTASKMTYDFARYYNSYYASVIEPTVKRGLNNPSIIMWSLGNEITNVGNYTEDDMNTLIGNMKDEVHKYDTSRPITMGEARPGQANGKAGMALMDVIGLNYADKSTFDSIRSLNPNTPMYGSETTSALSSRGVYARDDANKQCSSFDDDAVFWGEFASSALKKHMLDISFSAGMFVWTGFDYIGEPTPFNSYPAKSSYFGIYDTCGFPKDIMYMYQSRWTSDPMIHILPHWDWESGNKTIWLYSNCYKVELFLNGTSLGSKFQSQIGDKYQFEYSVAYTKGTLVANGYNQNGDIVAQDIIYTSQGIPTTTKLSTDKTSVDINSDDLIFITCDIIDKNGVIVPTANNKITFSVEGGTIIGTDNGNAACVEKYRSNVKSAFNGKVLCVVKHDGLSGNMVIKANGNNLTEQSITVVKGDQTVLTQKTEQSFIDATNPTIYDYSVTIKKYTVTNDLTNCTNSNDTTTIDENSMYSATITANSGYRLESVTVTMGETDITSTAYSNGTITINSVTGNIVITANANIQHTGPNILYSLPEETTFNGSSTYIDTGVALLSTDQDFTIALDVTASESQNNNKATLFHCMHEADPWPGIAMMCSDTNGGLYIPNGNNSTQIGTSPFLINLGIRTKVVITKEGTTLSAYSSNRTTGTSTYTYTQVSENLLIGAYQETNGAKGRYFVGTVHDFKIYNKVFTSQEKDNYLNFEQNNISRVFKIDSTSMNTTDNTLTDNIAGISATLTGNPTVSGNQIAFTANDTFSFDISSLNLTNSDRTFRIKFTPTNLDGILRNVIGIGNTNNNWDNITSSYISSEKLILQHGSKNFANVGVGDISGDFINNRLSTAPVTSQEYELVISEDIYGNVRWYIDGTLVQDGTTTLFDPLYLSNTEGNNRSVCSYSLIEIYNGYCNDYAGFTNMVNNASSGGGTDIYATAEYAVTEARTFNGTSDYIDTGVQLFNTDKDFTIYLDFKGGSDNALQNALLHCMNEIQPWPGMNLTVGNSAYKIDYMGGSTETNPLPIKNNDTGRHKVFITKTSGTNAINIYVDGVELTQTLNGTMTLVTVTQNLLIGAYQDSDGTKGRFWKGTVNRCAVWIDKVLNTNEMSEVLS